MSKLKNLFSEYEKVRKTNLSEEQFASLVSTYPALLVTAADGVIDNLEQLFLVDLTKDLAVSFATDGLSFKEVELLSYKLFAEYAYLSNESTKWEASFIEALKDELTSDDEGKIVVLQTMVSAAQSSEGVSEAEQAVIDSLSQKLNLK
jgi:tellurite resistance protein